MATLFSLDKLGPVKKEFSARSTAPTIEIAQPDPFGIPRAALKVAIASVGKKKGLKPHL
jgi:hypothetical protein